MQTVVETPRYLKDAKAAGVAEDERWEILSIIASNPTIGDEIKGTGGARKVRFAGRGKGKSGGYRIITFYTGVAIPVFLLALYSKGERANLSAGERNELRRTLGAIAASYGQGARRS